MFKVFDCFPYFNERELLWLRLAELYDTVDKFIIVEANKTHTGNPKGWNYLEDRDLYKEFADKIIYVQVEDLPDYAPTEQQMWPAENWQRMCIVRGLPEGLSEYDKIIVSDVDEIPSVEFIEKYRKMMKVATATQELYYYNVNCKQNCLWHGSIMVPVLYLMEGHNCQTFRNIARSGHNATTDPAGWHYSWMPAKPERIRQKVNSIAESHYIKDKFGTDEELAAKMANQTDLWNRNDDYAKKQIVDLATMNKPRKLKEFLNKWPEFHYGEINF